MSKRFIALILASSLTLAGFSAQPARAGNDDLEKFLIGAAALVILGTALESSRKEVSHQRHYKPRVVQPPRNVYAPRAYHRPLASPPKAKRRALLPDYCLRTVRSHKGPRTIYGKRCLQNNYRAFNALPDQCRALVRGPHGSRQGFRPGCLYRAGFRG